MSDRELLELAAKAAGIEYDAERSKPHPVSGAWWGLWLIYHREPTDYDRRYWNPLTDDGDALRLAVKLELTEVWFDKSTGRPEVVCGKHGTGICVEPLRDDPCAATRRAIVRAAAEIGKALTATPTAHATPKGGA